MRDEITEADNTVPSDGSGDEALSNQSSDYQDEDSGSDITSKDTHSNPSSNHQDEDSDNVSSSDSSSDDARSGQSAPPIASNSNCNKDCSQSDSEDYIEGVIFKPFGPGVLVYPHLHEPLHYIRDPDIPPVILPVISGKEIRFYSEIKNTFKVSEDCSGLIALSASEDERDDVWSLDDLFISVVRDKKHR